jgi:hypothetical protein
MAAMQAHKNINPMPRKAWGCGRRIRKPSPVLVLVAEQRAAIIHLARESPRASSDATRRLGRTALKCLPISSCSEWGLPCDRCYHRPGELLPHHFTLTARLARCESDARSGGIFSAALSLRSPSPAVDWHSVLWSSDFPPAQMSRRSPGSLRRGTHRHRTRRSQVVSQTT